MAVQAARRALGRPSPDAADLGGSGGLLPSGQQLPRQAPGRSRSQKPAEQGGSLMPKAEIVPSGHAEARLLCFFTKMLSRVSPPLRPNASRLPPVIGTCVRTGNIPSCVHQDLSREALQDHLGVWAGLRISITRHVGIPRDELESESLTPSSHRRRPGTQQPPRPVERGCRGGTQPGHTRVPEKSEH